VEHHDAGFPLAFCQTRPPLSTAVFEIGVAETFLVPRFCEGNAKRFPAEKASGRTESWCAIRSVWARAPR
jgi:hypothetical protein